MFTILERMDRLEAAVLAAASDGGPAHRIASDSQYATKSKGGGRKVASKAGEKRYGLPIGTPLGQAKSKDQLAKQAYDKFMGLETAADQSRMAGYMSNEELRTTASAVFSQPSGNERVDSARRALAKELGERGQDPALFGYQGPTVPINPNPKQDPTVKAKKAAAKAGKTKLQVKSKLDAEALADPELEALLQAGWKGDPNDAEEALYPPAEAGPIEAGNLSDDTLDSLVRAGWSLDKQNRLNPPGRRESAELVTEQKKAATQAAKDAAKAESLRVADQQKALAAQRAAELAAQRVTTAENDPALLNDPRRRKAG